MDQRSGILDVDDIWPDSDRRGGALERVGRSVLFDVQTPNLRRWRRRAFDVTRYRITDQERRVVSGLAGGLTRQETAEVLGVTLESVKHSVKFAKRKLQAKTLPQLVANAIRQGLIP
jgi:DNA-binding CsgD family transcriptional regulator